MLKCENKIYFNFLTTVLGEWKDKGGNKNNSKNYRFKSPKFNRKNTKRIEKSVTVVLIENSE